MKSKSTKRKFGAGVNSISFGYRIELFHSFIPVSVFRKSFRLIVPFSREGLLVIRDVYVAKGHFENGDFVIDAMLDDDDRRILKNRNDYYSIRRRKVFA